MLSNSSARRKANSGLWKNDDIMFNQTSRNKSDYRLLLSFSYCLLWFVSCGSTKATGIPTSTDRVAAAVALILLFDYRYSTVWLLASWQQTHNPPTSCGGESKESGIQTQKVMDSVDSNQRCSLFAPKCGSVGPAQ
jgi:hypothetical protein